MGQTRRLMVVTAVVAVFVALSPAVAQTPQVALLGPSVNQLAEGRVYDIEWTSQGIETVTLEAEGNLTSLPDSPRGMFNVTIAEKIPADQNKFRWRVPFIDSTRFVLKTKGYDSRGQLVAQDVKLYHYRIEILRTRTADGIYVDLRNPARQRLYRLKNNIVTHAYLTSGSRSGTFYTKSQDSAQPHDHVGVFRVTQKYPLYWSREYSVWMTHAMRFWKGHFIHGTYPSEYSKIGTPASSGCVRLHRTDARELFEISPIGTRVEIFGNLS
ncbi:MAG TPA: L,D-transpeptidase [Armatimonadota bacterium]|nr:L,D-transpeptidase [Armatimonadota bacterium]